MSVLSSAWIYPKYYFKKVSSMSLLSKALTVIVKKCLGHNGKVKTIVCFFQR